MMAIGKSIEQQIKNKNMSLKEFSKEADISYNTLYAIVKRDNATIKPEILRKIAKTLDIQLSDLFDTGEEITYYNLEDGTRDTIKKDVNGVVTRHIHLGNFSVGESSHDSSENALLSCFRQLNFVGKKEALKRIEELSLIPKYISTKETPTTQ